MHRFMLSVVAERVFDSTVMHLADGFDGSASFPQILCPSRDTPVKGLGIVPAGCLVDGMPGAEGGARRDADRAGRIGVRESDAGCCEPVQRRRVRQIATCRSELSRIVPIAHNDDEILPSHNRQLKWPAAQPNPALVSPLGRYSQPTQPSKPSSSIRSKR